jgi:hypothetical protein
MLGISTALAVKGAVALGGAALLATAATTAGAVSSSSPHRLAPAAASATTIYLGRVVSPTGVVVRFGPTTVSARVGSYNDNALIRISCKVIGLNVNYNATWYKVANTTAEWVSARYVDNVGAVPGYC